VSLLSNRLRNSYVAIPSRGPLPSNTRHNTYCHVNERLQTGFGLVIGFIELLKNVITYNYSTNVNSLQHVRSLLSLLCLHRLSPSNGFKAIAFSDSVFRSLEAGDCLTTNFYSSNCLLKTLSSELKSHCDWRSVSQSVSQSVSLGVEHPSGTHDQIFIIVWQLQSCYCGENFWDCDKSVARMWLVKQNISACATVNWKRVE
jgi:hypothetical protein